MHTQHQQTPGKNRRRGKGDNDNEKRELTIKEEGQEVRTHTPPLFSSPQHAPIQTILPQRPIPGGPPLRLVSSPLRRARATVRDSQAQHSRLSRHTRTLARLQYAQCMKMLGSGRITAQCFDGKTRLAHIRGKMRKKEWVNVGDIVLLGLRDYQDDKADVIQKFNAEEARRLKALGECTCTPLHRIVHAAQRTHLVRRLHPASVFLVRTITDLHAFSPPLPCFTGYLPDASLETGDGQKADNEDDDCAFDFEDI
jgi:initiation factor 1A